MKIGKIKFSICTFQFALSNIITLQRETSWRRRRPYSGGAGAPRQWALRVNGRSASMDALAFAAIHFNGSRRLIQHTRGRACRQMRRNICLLLLFYRFVRQPALTPRSGTEVLTPAVSIKSSVVD